MGEEEVKTIKLMSSATVEISYPYPSNLNLGNFVQLKLSSTTYFQWRMQFKGLIESQGMIGLVDGAWTAPPSVKKVKNQAGEELEMLNPKYQEWLKSDGLLKAWIISTLGDEALSAVVDLETARDVGETLRRTFAYDSEGREIRIQQQLQCMKRKDFVILTDYLKEFKIKCDELVAIQRPLKEQTKIH